MTNFTNKTFKETYRDFYDAEDGYHKVLFNAGRALQARELNEAQTIIQEELSRLGRNLFREGALVKAGGAMIDNEKEYIRINPVSVIPTDLVGKTYSSPTGLEFEILEVVEAEGSDPVTLYVRYTDTTSSTDNSVNARVQAGEVITELSTGSDPMTVATATTIPASGLGTKVSVNESEFFILGHFVYVAGTSTFISKYSSTPTADFGFKVEQLIITEADDVQLYDNQSDEPNITSPGAHRYKIQLTPTTRDNITSDDNFVYICRIVDGVITQDTDTNDSYNIINDLLATRTKEESGDYVAKEFKAIFTDKDETNLQLEVTEGTAYVDGYRLNFPDTFIDVPKSQETTLINNGSTPATYGNYIEINSTTSFGLSPMNAFGEVDLIDGSSNILGTAFVRGIETYGASLRLFLFNIKMDTGFSFRDVASIETSNGDSKYFVLNTPAQLLGSTDNSLLFPLAGGRPESISDMNFVSQRVIEDFTVSGDGIIQLPSNVDLSYVPIVSNSTSFVSPTLNVLDKQIVQLPVDTYTVVYWQQTENPTLRSKALTQVTETGLQIVEAEGATGPLYTRYGFFTFWQVETTSGGERVRLWWG